MTVGEKIQFYRKQSGLSQEALGQKLLVSRQTVSLWEMDKTLPTIDNLLRLKEIFSVSIDDILSESNPVEEQSETPERKPKETYIFQYNKSELKEIFKKVSSPLIKRAMIFTLSCIAIFIFLAIADADVIIPLLLLGAFLVGIISHIKGYFAYSKMWKSSADRISQNIYSYEIFDGYFVLNIFRNEEIKQMQKIYFSDIEKSQSFRNYLLLEIAGQSYIIKKNTLLPDSALIHFCRNSPDKIKAQTPKNALRTISNLLFILSICTIWFSLFGTVILIAINHKPMPENMWVFFVFLPIPLASIIYGFYLKIKGYAYKKNVIVGVIMAVLLSIYGSFTFIFADAYSHTNEPILNAEKMLNIDIPIHSQITTQEYNNGMSSPRGIIYSESAIYFKSGTAKEFERDLPNDPKWISSIPNNLIGITSYQCEWTESNYYIIYNADTGEFNKLPEKSGTYHFINVLYDTKNNTMKIVEYQIDYNR